MIERQNKVYTFKCPHCGHDKARHVTHQTRDIQYLLDPETMPEELSLLSIRAIRQSTETKIECSHCLRFWNTKQHAVDAGAFHATATRTVIIEETI